MDKRLNIIVGHYGSGKTEFALNYAFKLKEKYEKVYIIDLDIVNPYFRTADVKNELSMAGIDVIASEFACTNVDIPALPSDIYRVFNEKDAAVVIDVGGDDDGAIALGRYKEYFDKEPYELLFIVNTCRPLTKTAIDIKEYVDAIEHASRLKVTAMVNNTNLSHLTTPDIVLDGQKIVAAAACDIGCDVKYISAMADIAACLPDDLKNKAFILKRFLKLPESQNGGVR